MRNIVITTFVTLLMLGTAIIGSGHIALAHTRDLSNSGNYLVNDQNCTAGNSCNLSSSNTVTGSSGLTSPPPSTAPTPTTLTVNLLINQPITGTLTTDTGSPVAGATITFTEVSPSGITSPVTTQVPTVTNNNGNYQAFPTTRLSPGYNIIAHYAGSTQFAASDSAPSTVP